MAIVQTYSAEKLAAWMQANDITDTALAKRLKVSRQAVGHWRKGNRVPGDKYKDEINTFIAKKVK